MVRDGVLTRDEAVRRLRQHLREAMDRKDPSVIGALVMTLRRLAAHEALDDIREAFERGFVEPSLVSRERVEKVIAEGEARVRRELDRLPPTGVPDAIQELQQWAVFQEEPPDDRIAQERPRKLATPPPGYPDPLEDLFEPVAPVSHSRGPRVGGNDPCPCGSGKKFKKCCGSGKRDQPAREGENGSI